MQRRQEPRDFVVGLCAAVHLTAAAEWKLCPTKAQFAAAVADFASRASRGAANRAALT